MPVLPLEAVRRPGRGLPPLEAFAERAPPGVLATIGRILDIPGRFVRRGLTGLDDPSGRDVLERLGVLQANQPGLDVGDVAGFAAEVALDPLTYVGGIGALTKGGKLSTRGLQLQRDLRALRAARQTATNPEARRLALEGIQETRAALKAVRGQVKEAGGRFKLGKTAAEQGRRGQRALLSMGLPFTAGKPVITGAPVLGAAQALARATGATGAVRGLRSAFDPRTFRAGGKLYDRSEEARPFFELAAAERTGAALEGGPARQEIQAALEREGISDLPSFRRQRETPGQPASPLAAELRQRTGSLASEEIQAGARAGGNLLRSETVVYAERVLSQEAKDWLRQTGQEEAFFDRLVKKATTRTGSQIKRREELVEVFTDEADQFFQKSKAGLKGHWFEFDPAKSFPQRYVSGKVSIANARLFDGLASSFGNVPHVPGQTMAMGEFLAKGPLHRWRGITLPAEATAIERRLAKAGLGGRGIPLDIAEEALEVHRKLSTPEEVGALLSAVDAATGLWRTALTIPFPAFHFRNLLSDSQLSWLGGGANPRLVPEAFRLARDPQWLERMEKLGILRGTQARAVLEGIGATEKRGKFLERLYERFPRVGKAAEKSGALAGSVENFTRTWHFLSMKAKGLTDLEAARSVRRWLLDYGDLTDFERQVMKRAIFFYQWPRKVLPRLMESFFTEPGRSALLTRLAAQPTQQPDVPVHEFLRQTSALPSPFGPGPEGEPRFITGLGSPYEEFQKFDVTSPEGGALGAMRKLARTVGTNLSPALRIPAELASGRDLYFDRDIIRGDRAEPLYGLEPLRSLLGVEEQQLPSGDTRLRGDPLALYLMRASPLSRFATTAGDVANVAGGIDQRTGRGEDLARILTGIRSVEVGEEEQARAAQEVLRRLLERLVREGKAGEKRIRFALGPEGEKDPEALGLVAEDRAIQKVLERLRAR